MLELRGGFLWPTKEGGPGDGSEEDGVVEPQPAADDEPRNAAAGKEVLVVAVVLPPPEEQQQQQAVSPPPPSLLLGSTARLVRKLHPRDGDGDGDDDDDDDKLSECGGGGMTSTKANAASEDDDEGQQEEAEEEEEEEEAEEDDKDDDDHDNEEDQQEDANETTTAARAAPPPGLEHLVGADPRGCLADLIGTALQDISKFRDRDRGADGNQSPKKKEHRHHQSSTSLEERRRAALEHQRDRLWQQQQQQQQQQDEATTTPTSTNNNNNQQRHNNDDAWLRLARTLNSLAVLTPLLHRMLHHEHRHNRSMRLQTVQLRDSGSRGSQQTSRKTSGKKRKQPKPQCWLLGSAVFDVANQNRCQAIERQLAAIYDFFMPTTPRHQHPQQQQQQQQHDDDHESSSVHDNNNNNNNHQLHNRMEALEQAMQWLVQASACSSSSLSDDDDDNDDDDNDDGADDRILWKLPQTVLSNLDAAQQQKLEALLPAMDQKFGFTVARTAGEEQEHEQYLQSVRHLHRCLEQLLTRRFPGSRLSLYGSCLSDLSLGRAAADVDLSLHVPELHRAKRDYESGRHASAKRYQDVVKKIVYQTVRCIERQQPPSGRRGRPHHPNRSNNSNSNPDFCNMVPVTRARVPVVRGTYSNSNLHDHPADGGALDFDICFGNDIAVANSDLLRQYGLVDARARALILAVKRWARAHGLSSAQDNHLSSYAWVNLVVFYLQCIGLVPNLQCPKLRERAGVAADPDRNEWHRINSLDTFYLTWEQARAVWKPPPGSADAGDWQTRSVTALLYGFFSFYSQSLPGCFGLVSIKRGRTCRLPKTVFQKVSFFPCIEDPFESYSSHVPHDLGIPVTEPAARHIAQCFRQARDHLGAVLLRACSDSAREDVLAAEDRPWPRAPASKNGSTGKSGDGQKNSKRGGNAKTSNKKRGKEGGKAKQTQQPMQQPTKPKVPSHEQVDQKKNSNDNSSNRRRNRQRGGGNRGACFVCHQLGHLAASCPNKGVDDKIQHKDPRNTEKLPLVHPVQSD